MLLESLLAAFACVIGVRALGLRERHSGLLLLAMAVSGAATVVALAGERESPVTSPIALVADPGFATSNACRSCHPAEYASWHDSFHRRMTQRSELSALAGSELRAGARLRVETGGRSVELFGQGSRLWARLPDPGVTSAAAPGAYETSFRAAPLRDVPVELLTGSHHQQAFWVKGARQGELRALPVVYLIDERRLIARRDAFLNPPDEVEQSVRWNSNCVQCHAVAGAPGHDPQRDVFETSAAELGIACEACHGEGARHARAMQNPLARYEAHRRGQAGHGVLDPRRLAPERASQICGRCHSYFFPKQETDWWQHGFTRSYEPGQDLARAQLLLSPEALAAPNAPELGASADSLFYRDGTIRVAGREYNGLVRSPCYERGRGAHQLSCLSCHSLHQGAPNDQLDPRLSDNRACTQCHTALAQRVSAHTHHAETSAGSLCYNCHMPHTSYALLGAIRSHRVDSPTFDDRTRDRPNACNLCHLEQSEAWAADAARAWYGSKPAYTLQRTPDLSEPHLPAAAIFALTGDAAVRAITAAALGRSESAVPAAELREQLLARLAADDYAAVRTIAERSRRQLPRPSTSASQNPPLPAELVARLSSLRDRRPVTIAE